MPWFTSKHTKRVENLRNNFYQLKNPNRGGGGLDYLMDLQVTFLASKRLIAKQERRLGRIYYLFRSSSYDEVVG